MDRYCRRCDAIVPIGDLRFADVTTDLCYRHCVVRLREQVNHSNSRARCAGNPASLTLAEWIGVLEGTGARCRYCGCPMGFDGAYIEHRIPIDKNGPSTKENVTASCHSCNLKKDIPQGRRLIALSEDEYAFLSTIDKNLPAAIRSLIAAARSG